MRSIVPAVVVSLCLCLSALAGDLNPPPGPVTPTDRVTIHGPTATLPITIDEPGSYVLTGNITGVAGESGIIITASNVTLDLNGFSLIGTPETATAIGAPGPVSGITIKNGTIDGWGTAGIVLPLATSSRVEHVISRNNNGFGIALDTDGTVTDCTVSGNTDGVFLESGVVRNVLADGNSGNGIQALTTATISDCHASSNGGNGILTQSRSVIRDNHTSANAAAGIAVTSSFNMISDNTSNFDGIGINVTAPSNTIIRNTVTFATASHYSIAGANTMGPIINTTGGATITSAQPFANLQN